MAQLSIIGSGSMGRAIATVATKGGSTVDLLGRSDLRRHSGLQHCR
ncbi:3-hydroxyacyl-CoA dehydrogenase NAD-binding domain-containing protein [Streptomyces sp. TP-A0874]|nr:3-hydroxyacyl-CoA dehydrogenase NAD-binding domain-containing protein [Streptomyces sp. TP-A0874]